jgi:hypothetical protein
VTSAQLGYPDEAMKCVRAALYLSTYQQKQVALIHAANILHRAGHLAGPC